MPLPEAAPTTRSGAPERDVWLTIPNALTAARVLAIAPFTLLAAQGRDTEALVLFVVAGLTDTLDGTIARHFGQASKIGRLLDPLADKLFTGASFVVLSAFRGGLASIPMWVMVAVLLRDVLILSGSFVVYRVSRNSGFKPSVYGKLNTLLEIAIVVFFLAQPAFPPIATILPASYIVLLISLLVSAGDYLRAGLRMTRESAANAPTRQS
jgi:cardiolipin synthase (CMP-forming)